MADLATAPSRRALLQTLALVPATASALAITPPWTEALVTLHDRYGDHPVTLVRTGEGRSLSHRRYRSAEFEMESVEAGFFSDPRDVRIALHRAGSITKLALCAYLLDVGFSDAWLAEHIQQDIEKALGYANATGLGHGCTGMARLAIILTPYWKWGYPHLIGDPPMDDGGFVPDQIRLLMRALLNRVQDVTGHPRPEEWHPGQQERRS